MPTKILLLHSGNEAFVQLDRELLRGSFVVDDYYARRKFPDGAIMLWRAIKGVNIVFCWFASWNSLWALLFSKLQKKKSILVIGGYDLANLPEAGYGHQRGGFTKWISRSAMYLATVLFTNSYYSRIEAERNAGIPAQSVRVIYHGVPDPFGSLPQMNKQRIALTVGKVDFPNLKRKGLQAFVQAAAYLPDVQFVVVGAWADKSINYLRTIASNNVTFTGRITDNELLDYYCKASVYVQASLHEGFGMSVAEAMLAECIPVVTKAGSLPEVVGDCGFYTESTLPQSLAATMKTAFDASRQIRSSARERILNHFPLRKRQRQLEELIGLLL